MLSTAKESGECDRRSNFTPFVTDTGVVVEMLEDGRDMIPNLAGIYENAYREYPEYAVPGRSVHWYLNSLWEEGTPEVLVAKKEDRIIGFIMVDKCGEIRNGEPIGEVHEFAVDYESRGLRVGSTLLETGINYLRENGLRKIMLSVGRDNKPALSLYKKYGFKITSSGKKWTEMERVEPVESIDRKAPKRRVVTRRFENNKDINKVAL